MFTPVLSVVIGQFKNCYRQRTCDNMNQRTHNSLCDLKKLHGHRRASAADRARTRLLSMHDK